MGTTQKDIRRSTGFCSAPEHLKRPNESSRPSSPTTTPSACIPPLGTSHPPTASPEETRRLPRAATKNWRRPRDLRAASQRVSRRSSPTAQHPDQPAAYPPKPPTPHIQTGHAPLTDRLPLSQHTGASNNYREGRKEFGSQPSRSGAGKHWDNGTTESTLSASKKGSRITASSRKHTLDGSYSSSSRSSSLTNALMLRWGWTPRPL